MENKTPMLGFVLIGIVLVVWMWYITPPAPPPKPPMADTTHQQAAQVPVPVPQQPVAATADTGAGRWGSLFAGASSGSEGVIKVKTDLYTATLSIRGGLIREWELAKYKTWDNKPVELVDFDHQGDLSVLFTSRDGRLINTHDLYFTSTVAPGTEIQVGDSYTVEFALTSSNGGRLVKQLTFSKGSYAVRVNFRWENMASTVANYEYQVVWESGLRFAEENSVDEASFACAYTMMGGEVKEVDASKPGETAKFEASGNTSWVAARTKYFAMVMIPDSAASQGVFVEGHRIAHANNGVTEAYNVGLKMPLKGGNLESAGLLVYLGPLDYDIIKGYGQGLPHIVNLGAAWIIRPIAEYIMLPLFQVLRMVIPNYGVVIIVFAAIIMFVTYPLTRSTMKSMRKMQQLQPMMDEVREKYKDNPEKMNQAIFGLYREYGVNPAGSCLPVLLQMPVLLALYAVLRSNIELRHASFIWWIHDLSIPDFITHLPFTIPFFGISAVSGLALAMGVTTFVQQKMSVTDPRQKGMVYIMPVFLTLIFNSLPSGLNLYYFTFNLLSIGQRVWMNKTAGDEPLRKVDPKKRKPGFMERLTKDMPKLNK